MLCRQFLPFESHFQKTFVRAIAFKFTDHWLGCIAVALVYKPTYDNS